MNNPGDENTQRPDPDEPKRNGASQAPDPQDKREATPDDEGPAPFPTVIGYLLMRCAALAAAGSLGREISFNWTPALAHAVAGEVMAHAVEVHKNAPGGPHEKTRAMIAFIDATLQENARSLAKRATSSIIRPSEGKNVIPDLRRFRP